MPRCRQPTSRRCPLPSVSPWPGSYHLSQSGEKLLALSCSPLLPLSPPLFALVLTEGQSTGMLAISAWVEGPSRPQSRRVRDIELCGGRPGREGRGSARAKGSSSNGDRAQRSGTGVCLANSGDERRDSGTSIAANHSLIREHNSYSMPCPLSSPRLAPPSSADLHYPHPVSSRPPPSRKVISSDRPPAATRSSSTTSLSKPLKARVDLSSLNGGGSGHGSPLAPQLNWAPSSSTSSPRARVQFNDPSSAPSTPPLGRASSRPGSSVFPSHASTSQAVLSPGLSRSTSPTRPKSPEQRQPNGGTPQQSSRGSPGYARGYTDPFPVTINHLPASVTTRSIHGSPSTKDAKRAASPVHFNTQIVTSPGLMSKFEPYSTVPKRPGGGRRVSGGPDNALLPPHQVATSSKAFPASSMPPPRVSSHLNNLARSPTLAPPPTSYFSSSAPPASTRTTPKPSRPPSIVSNPASTGCKAHRRSNSVSSTTSGLSREEGQSVGPSRAASVRQRESPTFEPQAEWPTAEQEEQLRRQKEEAVEKRGVDEREKEARVQRKVRA